MDDHGRVMEERYTGDLPAKTFADRTMRDYYVRSRSWPEFFASAPDELPMLVPGLIPAGQLGFLAAAPKRGKTWIGTAIHVGCATGTSVFGFDVPEPFRTLYVALEGHPAGIKIRMACLLRGAGFEPAAEAGEWRERLDVSDRKDLPAFDLMDESCALAFCEYVVERNYKLVTIDVTRAAAPRLRETGDGAVDFATLRRNILPLLNAGITVLFLHHFKKSRPEDAHVGELMTGSGALYGAMDFGIFIKSEGAESWGREVDLTFEARDFEPPETMKLQLEGDGRDHGSFTIHDGAAFRRVTGDTLDKTGKAIIAFLEKQAEPVSKTAIRDAKLGAKNRVSGQLARLVQGGYVQELPGSKAGWKVYAVSTGRNDRPVAAGSPTAVSSVEPADPLRGAGSNSTPLNRPVFSAGSGPVGDEPDDLSPLLSEEECAEFKRRRR